MKTSGKNIGIILLASLLLGGAGFGGYKAYKWWKNRKQTPTDGGNANTSTTTTSGGVWTKRTPAETTAIQQKLNALYNADKIGKDLLPSMKHVTMYADTNAVKAFKNMMGGAIAVDGQYGNDTNKAVRALQTFLKTLKIDIGKSGIDGKYGNDTDKATGWNILK